MTETPPAAPAVPVAPAASAPAPAPAAPAAAPVAVPPVVAPVAAAPPAVPGGAPAPSVAPPVESLMPADPGAPPAVPQTAAEKLAEAKALVLAAEAAADPNGGKAWLLTDGVMGAGEKPAWFKTEKYKTVSAQAEAYVGLEKRFGAFTGAPKNEKGEIAYGFTPPEGVQFNAAAPLMQTFNKWAAENQLSQDGYSQVLGQLIQYHESLQPQMADVKSSVGDNVDGRIANTAAWAKANLGAEGYALLRDATSLTGVPEAKRIAATFKLAEALIGKTSQARLPAPGADVPAASGGEGLNKIKSDHGAKMPDGKTLKVDADPSYRLEIEKRYRDYYATGQQ